MKYHIFFAVTIALLSITPGALANQESPPALSLADCLKIAMEKNTGLGLAARERNKAELQVTEAIGKALPDLDLSATYTRAGKNPEVEFFGTKFKLMPDSSYQAQASLSQYIYSGAVASGYRASKLYLDAASGMETATRQGLAARVKTGFYAIIFTREVITTVEEAVMRLESHLKDSRDREAVGLNTTYDSLRLETRLAEEKHKLLEAKNAHDRARLELLGALGLDPMSQIQFAGHLEDQLMAPYPVSLEEAATAALERRPELAAAKARLSAAREVLKAVKSQQYPTLRAFGNYRVANNVGIGDSDKLFDQWSAGLTLEMNIFDGRERASRIGQRLEETEMELMRLEELERNVKIEVRTAYEELARAEEFSRSQKKNMEFAKETYRIATVNYQEGVLSQLELMDAQMALTVAGINQQKALFEHASARARLEWAVGEVEQK